MSQSSKQNLPFGILRTLMMNTRLCYIIVIRVVAPPANYHTAPQSKVYFAPKKFSVVTVTVNFHNTRHTHLKCRSVRQSQFVGGSRWKHRRSFGTRKPLWGTVWLGPTWVTIVIADVICKERFDSFMLIVKHVLSMPSNKRYTLYINYFCLELKKWFNNQTFQNTYFFTGIFRADLIFWWERGYQHETSTKTWRHYTIL